MREDWEEICGGRGGRVDTGVTIVSTFLDLRGDQLPRIETNTGQIDFKCDFFFKPQDY